MLASSFNFQGRVRKTFFVLTDDKVGSGPRLRPGALSQAPADDAQPMETDSSEQSSSTSPKQSSSTSPEPTKAASPKTAPATTLAAKLAAQAVKRKATDSPNPAAAKQRPK
jgi:hypothetical protein